MCTDNLFTAEAQRNAEIRREKDTTFLCFMCVFAAIYANIRRGGGKRSAVFVTECTMIEPTPLIRETEVV